jgi:hypothetical protein
MKVIIVEDVGFIVKDPKTLEADDHIPSTRHKPLFMRKSIN